MVLSFLCLSETSALLAQQQEHLIGTPQREAMFAINIYEAVVGMVRPQETGPIHLQRNMM